MTKRFSPGPRRRPTQPLARRALSALRAQRLEVGRILGVPRLQPKLPFGPPDDAFESEAGRVADEVTRMPTAKSGEPIQRTCTECEEETLQRQPVEPLQPQVTVDAQAQIDGLRGKGHPLPESSRTFFESRFCTDFSGVRIHSGGQAAQAARAVKARAFTVGRDVVFGAGAYTPESPAGRHLLAHELTHVVQQGASQHLATEAPKTIRRAPAVGQVAPCEATEYPPTSLWFSDPLLPRIRADDATIASGSDGEAVAAESARGIRTKARTRGRDVVFSRGQYAPERAEGRSLLTHELAHVVQQASRTPVIQRQALGCCPGSLTIQRSIGDGHDLQAARFAGSVPLEAAFDNERVIGIGSNGDHVSRIQQALVDSGYPLPKHGVDGVYGSETFGSVKSYQHDNGLITDGHVGAQTMGDLDNRFANEPGIPQTQPPLCLQLPGGEETLAADAGLPKTANQSFAGLDSPDSSLQSVLPGIGPIVPCGGPGPQTGFNVCQKGTSSSSSPTSNLSVGDIAEATAGARFIDSSGNDQPLTQGEPMKVIRIVPNVKMGDGSTVTLLCVELCNQQNIQVQVQEKFAARMSMPSLDSWALKTTDGSSTSSDNKCAICPIRLGEDSQDPPGHRNGIELKAIINDHVTAATYDIGRLKNVKTHQFINGSWVTKSDTAGFKDDDPTNSDEFLIPQASSGGKHHIYSVDAPGFPSIPSKAVATEGLYKGNFKESLSIFRPCGDSTTASQVQDWHTIVHVVKTGGTWKVDKSKSEIGPGHQSSLDP